MLAEEVGGGEPVLRETRMRHLCLPSEWHFRVEYPLLLFLASIYATISVVILLMQVSVYIPEFRNLQTRHSELLESMSKDLVSTKRMVSEMSSIASDMSGAVSESTYQMAMLSTQFDSLLRLNGLELNATLSLIKIFT